MKTIDYTTARKSKRILICPVCGRKGLLSVSKTENTRSGQIFNWTDTYQHRGYYSDGGARVITDLCVFDHVSGEQVSRVTAEAAADPRTPEQRQLDQHAAEVLDTQESDRP